ncbi:hypothetical protein [Spiribacter insolitus]|uniref:Sulfoxide reductase heme-binding subunit YedZ n=1 Tax=Spiribacter insolitus TaxID=3122417 RepID=A0ABV3T8F3_9GAMM
MSSVRASNGWLAAVAPALVRPPSKGWMRFIRLALFAVCALPAALLISGLLRGDLGVNPVETLLNQSGLWALRFLVLTLAVTPLRWLTGAAWVIRLRRQVGLWAFFYAASHFLSMRSSSTVWCSRRFSPTSRIARSSWWA